MIDRFRRIKDEFGTTMLARTLLLVVGLIGMSAFGFFLFKSPWMLIVSVSGLGIGWLLRKTIVDQFEVLSWVMPIGLMVYGVVLFIGDKVLGSSGEMQLLIVTITTVVVFDIQFWSYSDPSIINTERE